MNRLIIMILAVMEFLPIAFAQNSISGTVVDRDGRPLPGVKIEIPGSREMVLSDLDGTFTINTSGNKGKKLTATYAGMSSQKVKMEDGMIIRMAEPKGWNYSADEGCWFAEAVVAMPNYLYYEHGDGHNAINPAYGIMIGRIQKFGYYIKALTNTFGKSAVKYDSDDMASVGFVEDTSSAYWSVAAGAIFRIWRPVHLYAGLGCASYKFYFKDAYNDWYDLSSFRRDDIVVDLGVMMRIKRFTVSIGAIVAPVKADNFFKNAKFDMRAAGNLGVGYSF